MTKIKKLTPAQAEKLLSTLEKRFVDNMERHKGLKWADLKKRLLESPEKLCSLNELELSGGEPDVIGYEKKTDTYNFCDCSAESPKERRSLCYDQKALNSRKENKPKGSVENLIKLWGVELLDEPQYRELQKLGEFDLKTSSWIKTPPEVRGLGGALFCDRRYDKVFVYHNGAESYYAARGFRALLKV